ncbi:SDR family oxidoreductase [Brevibacterium sp. 50QC2O2]|uniref:SDR family NAD(P)-dependent oxidoreductase n=1 Tax=Brevibacterium sp. 50QC2O2 TaxID=2968459 RepID=UPI00211CDD43|nr:SDR family oxidoreductase [Brevibacterium sp. 50QC2O2]MCQ9388477.1 SDR family oxidoreductase [Brevibacterium sp. 50QC2O2]
MTTPPFTGFDGKKALITGAADGLGKAVADALHAAGAQVWGTSRSAETTAQICARYGTEPIPGLDLSRPQDIASFADAVDAVTGGIDLLVNNAGVNVPKPALEITEDDWDTVFDINVKGTFLISQAFARTWVGTKTPGAIVNMASQAGIVAIEERAAYGSSKAALIHLTKQLALEWAQYGIRVNAVAPTFVKTALTASTLERGAWADELRSRIPLGRFGEACEVSGPTLYLLSDAASLVTGTTLVADGGYTIR